MGTGAVRPLAVALVVLLLAGCAATGGPTIGVVADSFCLASKKITWSIEDSKPTIDQIVRHNSGHDRACLKGKRPAPTS